MAEHSGEADSNSDILQELQRLSQSFQRAEVSRRTASLALPRTYAAATAIADEPKLTAENARRYHRRSHSSRHTSISPWRSRPQPQPQPQPRDDAAGVRTKKQEAEPGEKRGIWRWKPMRALAHMAMHRLACNFSVDVVAIHRLPPPMNGCRLSVAVRKKETKDRAVQTMPSLVLDCSADFEETLSIRCHLHCSGGTGTGKPLKFEPRPFLISAVAIDSPELDYGKNSVDLSSLVKESIEKNYEGKRIRQWNMSFPLLGEAKGGELLLKLAFQITDDGGVGIYKQAEVKRSRQEESFSSEYRSSTARSATAASSISQRPSTKEIVDEFTPNMFDHKPLSSPSVQDNKLDEEIEHPEFEVIDKGVEFEEEKKSDEDAILHNIGKEEALPWSEVLKVVVHDLSSLIELDKIAAETKASEFKKKGPAGTGKTDDEMKRHTLELQEELVTREFFSMLKLEHEREFHHDPNEEDSEKAYLSELGKGLGCVVQTKDGGYLVSMNPFNALVARDETPKLTMQISRALILKEQKLSSGFQVIQRMVAMGLQELGSELLSLTEMDELLGKTPEQIAFEGIASAIISGRNKEGGASSCAANAIAISKKMTRMMVEGKKESILRGTWNAKDEQISIEEILGTSLQRIEAMALDALKIQAENVDDQEASLEVSSLSGAVGSICAFESAFSAAEWFKTCTQESTSTMLLVVQLRDPLRSYEVVGAPIMAVMQVLVAPADGKEEAEKRFKLASLDLGGFRLRPGKQKSSAWDGEKQRMIAMQWLVTNGLVKGGGRRKQLQSKAGEDIIWSISSRVTEGVWINPTRNHNVKILS